MRLRAVCLLIAFLAASILGEGCTLLDHVGLNSCFIMEIFEIYCKIQNRLIFIMIIKTCLHLEKK